VRRKLEAVWQIPDMESRSPLPDTAVRYLQDRLDGDRVAWYTLCGWLFTHTLGKAVSETDFAQISRSWIDEWLLGRIIASALQDLGLDEGSAWRAVTTVKVLTMHPRWFETRGLDGGRPGRLLQSWLQDNEVRRFLQVNRYQGVLWFNHEAFDQLLWWMLVTATVALSAGPELSSDEVAVRIAASYDVVGQLQEAEQASEYRVERLLEVAGG